jgi:type IV pilus assembly protein PilW
MSPPFSPSCAEPPPRGAAGGFTLVELLVALAVGGLVLGGALAITLATRGMVWSDQARTRIHQDLRASIDLIGIDVRQAGERLPGDFPAVELVDGGGPPDRLVLRRNLLDVVLPLCETLTAGEVDDEIRIAGGGPPIPRGCNPVPDSDGDGWPDNVGQWRSWRLAQGGAMRAYLFNPISREGEWLVNDDDGSTAEFLANGTGAGWAHDYPADQLCRIYVLEERVYEMSADVLQAKAGDDLAVPFNLAGDLIGFEVRAHLVDGGILDALDATGEWTELETLEVTLTKTGTVGAREKSRSVTGRFLPRNILSN